MWDQGICTGLTLQPRCKAQRPNDDPVEGPTDEEKNAYSKECKLFETLVTSHDDSLWKRHIPNDYLRFFARRFLQMTARSRETPMQALALTYALGGIVEPVSFRGISPLEFKKTPLTKTTLTRKSG